jgi:hypothetical protein
MQNLMHCSVQIHGIEIISFYDFEPKVTVTDCIISHSFQKKLASETLEQPLQGTCEELAYRQHSGKIKYHASRRASRH